ncbi:hypothetical protein STAQ_09570 [Allostella sp. ATCC 35155]|nr:hypothetical protein STAQ_09570 [Stella sp. ATCC 35155]
MLPPTIELAQRATIRLVATAHLRPPALAPLADTDGDLADLAELESATSGRLVSESRGMAALAPGELVFGVPRATFINAAFAYTRPGGNRFNGEGRGAWYCAFECETALAEVAFHLTRALDAVGRYDNTTDYAELLADFIGRFHDLREAGDADCLDPDPAVGYPAGQGLARAVLEADGSGIIYPSMRRRGGTCFAALRPHIVQNVRSGATWRLVWAGGREPRTVRLDALQA